MTSKLGSKNIKRGNRPRAPQQASSPKQQRKLLRSVRWQQLALWGRAERGEEVESENPISNPTVCPLAQACPGLPRSHLTKQLQRGQEKASPRGCSMWMSGQGTPGLPDPTGLPQNTRRQAGTGQDHPWLTHAVVRWAGHLPTPSSLRESSGAGES